MERTENSLVIVNSRSLVAEAAKTSSMWTVCLGTVVLPFPSQTSFVSRMAARDGVQRVFA